MAEASMEELHERWRALCLELPGAFEDHPFGEDSTVFKVAGRDRAKSKMFGLLMVHRGELLLNLKCEPAIADQLRSEYDEIIPGYHMSKKHWNSVRPGLEPQHLRELVEDSYDLVVEGMPRRDREFIRMQTKIANESLD
ncbi:MmcQ-like protein [Arthrobacter sp. MYb211]|uniref:MmcQ/YjbR family DNA-binding protein n=1 Tax=unclassified Arthrobacter TaxID=235627 RepID=UPI000CFACB51|nr:MULTISPECIES: MmcQ/YjbR family DNA-binding protein [unclassified Arthrobacter]PRA11990.1 MmcQ-like protein [Arthrobacter sp. MYb221]PRC08344.1 MmcQ-like protein [Arthrobacter sp. MYb211]